MIISVGSVVALNNQNYSTFQLLIEWNLDLMLEILCA